MFEGLPVTSDTRAAIDLLIADVPENLPVPGISKPANSVPSWNMRPESYFYDIFEVADENIHDDGAFLLFYPDNVQLRAEIAGFCTTFHFKLYKDWWGFNSLPLASSSDPTCTVHI